MTLAFLGLGLFAGILTTIAGQGGGLILLLACSALVGPHAALAITAPALLLGNLHRAFLFRRDLDRSVALRVVAGALPGAVLGGILAGLIPSRAVQALLVFVTALTIAKALGWLSFQVPRAVLGPAGFVIGSLTGTAGGAGVLFSPLLLSSGLHGRAFVGTIAAIAFCTHVGRTASYAGMGLLTPALLVPILCVAGAIFVGNALGERARTRLPILRGRTAVLEYGALVLCVALSVAGLG